MSEDFEAPKDDLDKELPAGSEEHSDYKPADAKDANIKHQLSGMYQNWFLDYASYVILERAVPHIMDGLKPVQRRILHSMRRMEDGRYNKVANIVGHTMQFHPHGDASIGDARVTAPLPPVISKHVSPSSHWTWYSTPRPPNGNSLMTGETKNRLHYR